MKMNFDDMVSILLNKKIESFFYENNEISIRFDDETKVNISNDSISYTEDIVTDIVKINKIELELLKETIFGKEEKEFRDIMQDVMSKSDDVEINGDEIIFLKGGRRVVVTRKKISAYQDGNLIIEIDNNNDSYQKMRDNVERLKTDV